MVLRWEWGSKTGNIPVVYCAGNLLSTTRTLVDLHGGVAKRRSFRTVDNGFDAFCLLDYAERNTKDVMLRQFMSQTEIRAIRIRVLPGMTEEVVRWLRTIAANPADALEGLRSEGILTESFFMERNPDADYVLYVARANNMAEADRRYESSPRLFDVEARRFWDLHEQSADTLELIADLVVDCDNP